MEDILICQDTWEGKGKVAYTVVASVAQFFLPVLLVIMLYLSIYLKLKNRPQVRFFSRAPFFLLSLFLLIALASPNYVEFYGLPDNKVLL